MTEGRDPLTVIPAQRSACTWRDTVELDDLLTNSQAAEFAGVARSTVANWAARGLLPVAHRGARGQRLFRARDVARVEAATRTATRGRSRSA